MANNKKATSGHEVPETSENTEDHTRKVIQWEGDNWERLNRFSKELGMDYHDTANLLLDVYSLLTPEQKAEIIMENAKRRVEALLNNS